MKKIIKPILEVIAVIFIVAGIFFDNLGLQSFLNDYEKIVLFIIAIILFLIGEYISEKIKKWI